MNILILCTGNSCRSILAEAIFNQYGNGLISAYSAGSDPAGEVNRGAIDCLQRHGLPTEGFRSKNWNEFSKTNAPKMDAILTVCDSAAVEICPIWPGHPASAHWSLPDPAAYPEDLQKMTAVFEKIFIKLESAVKMLLETIDKNEANIDLSESLKKLSTQFY